MVSTNFYYDGISSESMGVYLIRTSSGLFSVPYIPPRDIIEDFPTMAKKPYSYKSKNQQYQINMVFSTLTNNMNATKLKEIASWLFQDDYKEFYSEDDPDKKFYLFASNQVDFMTNGANEGYFEVQWRSKFPYAIQAETTPTYTIDLSDTITLTNTSNVDEYYYPEVEFTFTATPCDFALINVSDDSRITSFTGLSLNETIYFDNEKKQIISDTGLYRYDNFNKNWFRLVYGANQIIVAGYVELQFRMNFPVFT
jgi:phage-related protein